MCAIIQSSEELASDPDSQENVSACFDKTYNIIKIYPENTEGLNRSEPARFDVQPLYGASGMSTPDEDDETFGRTENEGDL